MALRIQNTALAVLSALTASFNTMRRDSVVIGSRFHADITSNITTGDYTAPVTTSATITAANATTTPTLLALCADIFKKVPAHWNDALAHKTAASAVVLETPLPTDLTTAYAFLNDVKAKWATHIASTTHHYTADETNALTAADATTAASAYALAIEIKTDFNAHIISAPAGNMLVLL